MINQYPAPWIPYFQQTVNQELESKGSPPFIAMQLATIDSESGFPHVRTVIYRGFMFDDETTNVLTCCTDKRMLKYDQLKKNDKFEIVCYFPFVRKQFRFTGHARLIDCENKPKIELPVAKSSYHSSDEEDEEEEKEEKHEEKEGKHESNAHQKQETSHRCHDGKDNDNINDDSLELKVNGKISSDVSDSTEKPLIYPIISPSQLATLKTTDDSFITLSSLVCYPPTNEDWDQEIDRQWNNLSKNLKQSFRKPTPLSEMNDTKLKLIDSINRGVDGKKDIEGLKNFAIIGLFIELADFVDLDKDRRYIYSKDTSGTWSETEVCP